MIEVKRRSYRMIYCKYNWPDNFFVRVFDPEGSRKRAKIGGAQGWGPLRTRKPQKIFYLKFFLSEILPMFVPWKQYHTDKDTLTGELTY